MRKGPKAHNTQAAARLERQRKSEQFANPSRFTERNVLSSPSRHSLDKGGSSTFDFFQMIFFHLLPQNEKVFPFLRTEPLRAQSEKLSKESLWAQNNLEKNSKSARTNKSLRTLTRSRFQRDALSRLDRITIVESKSLSTHTHAHKRREKEREGERSFVEFLAST